MEFDVKLKFIAVTYTQILGSGNSGRTQLQK